MMLGNNKQLSDIPNSKIPIKKKQMLTGGLEFSTEDYREKKTEIQLI